MSRRKEIMAEYPKGAPRPIGYLAFHDWAEAQTAHGLKQSQCSHCQRWLFPQERDASHVDAATVPAVQSERQ